MGLKLWLHILYKIHLINTHQNRWICPSKWTKTMPITFSFFFVCFNICYSTSYLNIVSISSNHGTLLWLYPFTIYITSYHQILPSHLTTTSPYHILMPPLPAHCFSANTTATSCWKPHTVLGPERAASPARYRCNPPGPWSMSCMSERPQLPSQSSQLGWFSLFLRPQP